jgi:hypothetical protein
MKTFAIIPLLLVGFASAAQSVVGTWQLTDEKTCFQSALEENQTQTDTEKELSAAMEGSSKTSVAKLITFTAKGAGDEGIFTQGKKKGTANTPFRYQLQGGELQFLDKKSGMITSRYVIEELTSSTLRFHDAARDCEIKAFTRVK